MKKIKYFKFQIPYVSLFRCLFWDKIQEGKPKDGEKKPRKHKKLNALGDHLSAAQIAVNEQMRKALEEDQYSALGSIVDTDSEEEDVQIRAARGGTRLDRSSIVTAMRKRLWMDRMTGKHGVSVVSSSQDIPEDEDARSAPRKKKKKKARRKEEGRSENGNGNKSDDEMDEESGDDMNRDESSIFGQTSGSSNATWVECDKCKKVSLEEIRCYCHFNL